MERKLAKASVTPVSDAQQGRPVSDARAALLARVEELYAARSPNTTWRGEMMVAIKEALR